MPALLLRRSVASLAAASRPSHPLLRASACAAFISEPAAENKPLGDTLRELRASEHFDLIVIGSGPAGQKCAIDSAKHGKSVAIIDKRDMMGGVCVHTGTVPSKTFREAALHLTGYRHKAFYNGRAGPSKRFGVEDILQRVKKVEDAETDITRHQLMRNGVQLINGTARFLPGNNHMVAVLSNESYETATDAKRHTSADICKRVLTADKFLVCVGTRPARRPDIPFDGETIFDSDQLLWGKVKTVPRRLIVVGAGVIGMEYASMMTIIPGTDVTVIDGRQEILNMADKEVSEALCYSMAQTGTRFLVGETIKSVEKTPKGEVFVHLESGKTVVGDGLLYTVGRQGNVEGLNLEAVGLAPDKRGRIKVDNNFQTAVPHIYAAGDIIGFPGLASTSMEQGRLASVHMRTSKPLNNKELSDDKKMDDPDRVRTRMRSGEVFPFGIYTVPEISMVGKNEQQLTKEQVPYEVGMARYEELARGQMLGGLPGFLKIIFCPETLKILGVHAIGEGATEIIHIGQVVMSTGGTLEYFRNAVFNYPTLAEAYRVAALNGLRKVDRLRE
ncbi:putative soluble pyridine nucleotide transhydrogenase [Phytophthora rubi]|uniref:NAD(P)(+) transhydrogenase (Si-specific) n=1 Tax=Phytophthora rubi TaxID=129364 RepID=A0A6A4FWV1_9STRA|nr:putative soluble pyridine nucleotide transhydrogenase [Phytophthora rubi]KAE9047117.1 putative soluble pyridine nucleotide transhydrogenase [Phytophthora rubi]KAE9352372.1 putative soluble pyridine nucleotide transhydrogenase [Phytophthora rubi]